MDRLRHGSWRARRGVNRVLAGVEAWIGHLVAEGQVWGRTLPDAPSEIAVPPRDSDRRGIAPTPAVSDRQFSLLVEHLSSALSQHVEALTAPLTASYEQSSQLARENGALSERLASLERELASFRVSAAADQEALDEARRQVRDLTDAYAQLGIKFAARGEEAAPHRRWPWLLLALATSTVALAVGWAIGSRLPLL
jgi:hypothetical protein